MSSRHDDERLSDIVDAIAAIRNHLTRGDLSNGLIFDAVRLSKANSPARNCWVLLISMRVLGTQCCCFRCVFTSDIGLATLRLAHPVVVDDYRANRVTGSFVLIDEATNATVAAGMVGHASFL